MSAGLADIAGLGGMIREWEVQPWGGGEEWRPLPIRNDFGIWLRRDPRLAEFGGRPLRLRARIFVPVAREATLVLNSFAGHRLFVDGRLVAGPPSGESYSFADLRHRLTLAAGPHEVAVELDPAQVPPVFAARLLCEGAVAVSGVTGVPGGTGGSGTDGGERARHEETGDLDDSETFHYYNRLAGQAPRPRDAWRSRQGWERWREGFRDALRRLMPPPPGAAGVPLDAEVLERIELDDHVRETVRITVEPGWRTDVYVLVPRGHGAGPWPGVLCLHGHGRGKDDLVGIDRGDPDRRATIDALREDYALRYVRRGYVTATVGMRLIGDRGLPRGGWPRRDPCDNGYFQATMFGLVPAALDAWDAHRVLDLLAGRPEVAHDHAGPRLGCVGLSYGGRATMYVAALDERVRVAVVSGALNCFRERLVSFAGCGSQFVPGLFAIGDTAEILAGIAPRPLLLELGSRDGTSPAIFAEDMARTITRAYAAAEAPTHLAFDLFEGEHRFDGRLAGTWLDRWL